MSLSCISRFYVLLRNACLFTMSSSLLLACHAPTTPVYTKTISTQAQKKNALLPSLVLPRIAKTPLIVEMRTESDPKNPQLMRVHFTLTMPTPRHISGQGFTAQAINGNDINFVKVEIKGAGITTPLFADGANGSGLVPNAGGTYTLTISNVPYGQSRIATLTTYDATQTLILGAEAKTVFHVDAPTVNIELSYRTALTAEILENIPATPTNQRLIEQMDLDQLQTFVDTLIGVSGTAPNYSYTTHPSLIDSAVIATDLIANGGDSTLLNPSNPAYAPTSGGVQVTISGLIGPDTVDIMVNDPASTVLTGLGNGTHTITGIQPGDWEVLVTGSGYVADATPTETINGGATADAGTINMSVATAPTLSSLSFTSGNVGDSIQINGNDFHPTTAGNVVRFGTVSTTVTAASANQLTVTVPSGIWGQENVTVSVGGQTSGNQTYTVTPTITSLDTSSGVVGSTIEITGTGFDANTPANNTVRFNGVAAAVNSASNSLLNVTVPNTSNGNVTVQVGTQISNGTAFNILPTISLSSPLEGAVVSGSNVTLSATTGSGNSITQVEFFDGVTSLGIDASAPYSVNWDTTAVSSGSHALTATITDSQSNEVTSAGISVTVNQPPVINSITPSQDPVPGISHPIQLTALASDLDDTLNSSAYTWSCDGGCGSFNRTDSNTVIWTAPSTAGGPYTIRLSVSDGTNPAVVDTISLAVNSFTADVNIDGYTGGL